MIHYDYHLHTNYSLDSDTPMEDMIRRAVSVGLKEIAITDHWDYDYPDKYFPHQINYDDYLRVFNRLKEKYSKEINIVFGVEIGIGPQLGGAVASFVKQYPFEFIIGSIHDIKGQELYYRQYFNGLGKQEAYYGYFQYLLDSIRVVKDLCVVGHLDYISRYGGYPDSAVYYDEFSDIIDRILTELISGGKGIEINTSSYRYGINSVYPQLAILRRYRALGGEIITVGSDAHRAADVAGDFDKARRFLTEVGFDYICIFRDRKPKMIKI